MKQLLVISEVKARREQQCLPIHYDVIMQKNDLILLSNPPHHSKTRELITRPPAEPHLTRWPRCCHPAGMDTAAKGLPTVLMLRAYLREWKALVLHLT